MPQTLYSIQYSNIWCSGVTYKQQTYLHTHKWKRSVLEVGTLQKKQTLINKNHDYYKKVVILCQLTPKMFFTLCHALKSIRNGPK